MFYNGKTTGKRYEAEETAVSKPGNVVSRARRALGDITNSFGGGADGREANKKPTLSAPSSAVYPNVEENMTARSAMTIAAEDTSDRPYMKRESDNIDARDGNNPLLCTTYVNEMYAIYSAQERDMRVSASYMSGQQHVNERMRTILVDWLIDVHLKFKMVPETLYLTVHIIDRYLEQKQVRRSRLQLVGVAALLAASKYEEIYPPDLNDLVFITDSAYSRSEIVEMELNICETLQYYLTVPTTHTFLCRHLKAAHADRAMVQLACYLAERSMQEYSMIKFLPSVIAATAVLIARKSLKRHPWSPTLVEFTKYDEPDLQQCVNEMKRFIPSAASADQAAVYKKYSYPKFGSVSKMTVTF